MLRVRWRLRRRNHVPSPSNALANPPRSKRSPYLIQNHEARNLPSLLGAPNAATATRKGPRRMPNALNITNILALYPTPIEYTMHRPRRLYNLTNIKFLSTYHLPILPFRSRHHRSHRRQMRISTCPLARTPRMHPLISITLRREPLRIRTLTIHLIQASNWLSRNVPSRIQILNGTPVSIRNHGIIQAIRILLPSATLTLPGRHIRLHIRLFIQKDS